ncbi:uncharacterized protein, partial [Garra rufa]|uniref:uncharacterized protein n=1 Tax=Garra rufa TaxID=137080 RepID=UPI003CCEB8A9
MVVQGPLGVAVSEVSGQKPECDTEGSEEFGDTKFPEPDKSESSEQDSGTNSSEPNNKNEASEQTRGLRQIPRQLSEEVKDQRSNEEVVSNEENLFYCPEILSFLFDHYFAIFPLWSGVLLGNLKRYAVDEHDKGNRKMTKPKEKPCPHCQALNTIRCKTCRKCFATLSLKEKVKQKEKELEASAWMSTTTKNRNAARVVDSARIAVKKLEVLGYRPVLFISKKEKKKGFWAEVITSLGPFEEGPLQNIFERMTHLYDFFLLKVSIIKGFTARPLLLTQHQKSSVPPPSSSPNLPAPSSSSATVPPPP